MTHAPKPLFALPQDAHGGTWKLPAGLTPADRAVRWLEHGAQFPFIDSHCHLEKLRKQLKDRSLEGLADFAASRDYWPVVAITNYVFPKDAGHFKELHVSVSVLPHTLSDMR